MTYKAITTAKPGWYFVETDEEQIKMKGRPTVMRIAVWALTENDEVVGLGGIVDFAKLPTPRQTQLCSLSTSIGAYKHIDDFNQAERLALEKLTKSMNG